MTRPHPCLRIGPSAARHPRNVPLALTSMTTSQSFSVRSATGRILMTPAQLTRMPSAPNAATASSTMACTCAASVTSTRRVSAHRPSRWRRGRPAALNSTYPSPHRWLVPNDVAAGLTATSVPVAARTGYQGKNGEWPAARATGVAAPSVSRPTGVAAAASAPDPQHQFLSGFMSRRCAASITSCSSTGSLNGSSSSAVTRFSSFCQRRNSST